MARAKKQDEGDAAVMVKVECETTRCAEYGKPKDVPVGVLVGEKVFVQYAQYVCARCGNAMELIHG